MNEFKIEKKNVLSLLASIPSFHLKRFNNLIIRRTPGVIRETTTKKIKNISDIKYNVPSAPSSTT